VTTLFLTLLLGPPAEPVAVPYRLTDTKHVLVRVKLNGRGPFNLILDTGAPAVFIPKKLSDTLGVKPGDDGWGKFDRFELEGGLVVPEVRTRVEDLFQLEGMNGLGLAGAELHGVIGYNVLARYRITYDFSADALTWVPLTGFTPPLLSAGRGGGGQGGLEVLGPLMKLFGALLGVNPGFDTRPRGHLGFGCDDAGVVNLVLADGPAAKAGLRPGDTVMKVKGKPVAAAAQLEKAVAAVKPGDRLPLTVRRGDEELDLILTVGKGL
jgi:hypothetical protein